MKIEKIIKPAFTVIGKEGSTNDGNGFIANLWKEVNENFNEIAHLTKKDENGNLIGIWGAMSDLSHSFKPWENNFSIGLYLAGPECNEDAIAPVGWSKWIIPGYEYLKVEVEAPDTFIKMIEYLRENNIELVGAVHDFTDPLTGINYMYFPIRKL